MVFFVFRRLLKIFVDELVYNIADSIFLTVSFLIFSNGACIIIGEVDKRETFTCP